MAIIVFQHSDQCIPGRIGATLRDHGARLDIRRPDLPAARGGTGIPADFDDVEGVISLGGPQNVTDGLHWMSQEMAFLKGAHDRQLPVIGVCLGSQMIAAALGGTVGPMEQPEIGMVRVRTAPAGHTDTVLAGVPWETWQFQCHEQEVKSLPAGAVLLQSSDRCKVQCFRAGLRTYAFQYHLEADQSMMKCFGGECGAALSRIGSSADQFERECVEKYEPFARVASRLCVNFATYLLLTRRGIAV